MKGLITWFSEKATTAITVWLIVGLLAGALLAYEFAVRPDNAPIAAEDACIKFVQGNIAWDIGGNTRWSDEALTDLCENARSATQPGLCYDRVVHGPLDKGKGAGRSWRWRDAVALCAASTNATETIACFRQRVRAGVVWQVAISECSVGRASPQVRCVAFVQGKIAWDGHARRDWDRAYLERLCAGTRKPPQPGLCFDRVMHEGPDWGGGKRWEWTSALALCAGTSNADARIKCFKRELPRRKSWRAAIDACVSRDGADEDTDLPEPDKRDRPRRRPKWHPEHGYESACPSWFPEEGRGAWGEPPEACCSGFSDCRDAR